MNTEDKAKLWDLKLGRKSRALFFFSKITHSTRQGSGSFKSTSPVSKSTVNATNITCDFTYELCIKMETYAAFSILLLVLLLVHSTTICIPHKYGTQWTHQLNGHEFE